MPYLTRPSRLLRASTRAFSLVEILVVLAIIGLLVGLAVSNVDNIFGSSQEKVAKAFVSTSMKVPLTAYRMDLGDYPSTAEGLNALVVAPQGKADRWRGPYVEGAIPLDPWGRPYQYRYPGTKNKNSYDIWSAAKNEQDPADDIGNWVSETTTEK